MGTRSGAYAPTPRQRYASMRVVYVLLVAVCLVLPARAQYHLTEVGARLGGGVNFAYGTDALQPIQYGANLAGFYSHWVCGANWGYHVEAGFRLASFTESETGGVTLYQAGPSSFLTDYRFWLFELGGYFKIRKNNYHRDKEWALLIGPKLGFVLAGQARPESTGTWEAFESDTYREVLSVQPGIHLSVQWRLPRGNRYSFFIWPGVEWYPGANASTRNTNPAQNLRYLYGFISVGTTLWNSR